MVQVYLPMGYPQQSGQEFENVIYQGSVVRLYTVPKDPRSDAQLNQRRFLSDVTKMRSLLGKFGKAAMSAAMGSKWGTIVYQVIKADMGGWWSGALAEWNGFIEINKQAWRDVAPYKACFNDLGMIYFCLTRVLYRASLHFSLFDWEMKEWGETESGQANEWWLLDLTRVFTATNTDIWVSALWAKDASWDDINNVLAHNSWYSQAATSGAFGVFYIKARSFALHCVKGPEMGVMKVLINGQLHGQVDLYNSTQLFMYSYNVPGEGADPKKLMCIEVQAVGGKIGIDFIGLG